MKAPRSIACKLPAGMTEIEDNAFEGVPVTSVEFPESCTFVYNYAFKDCASLRQIRVLNPMTMFASLAFEGCSGVYVFAPEDSFARYLCNGASGFIFVADIN